MQITVVALKIMSKTPYDTGDLLFRIKPLPTTIQVRSFILALLFPFTFLLGWP